MNAERSQAATLPPRVVVRVAWILHRALYRFSGGRLGLRPPEAGEKFGMLRLGSMGWTPVARAPTAVLATPGAQDAGAETLPGPGAVQGVVAAAVGCSGVDRAATTRAAGHNSADRAQLHCSRRPSAVPRLTVVTLEYTPADIVMSVEREGAAVYSPRVLSPRHQRLRR